MKFELNMFPDAGPEQKSGEQYFRECLDLVELADKSGWDATKIVEHYFHPYGGYSPDPITFLSAASQRSKRLTIRTGCVLPVFTHPLKLAGQIAMLDCISGGRLEVGIARAFLPHEFDAFGVSMDESRARFDEGIEAIVRLLTEENVTFKGQFHQFEGVTSLPRPVKPPKIWIGTVATTQSFIWTGEKGYNLMAIPFIQPSEKARDHIKLYRETFAANHPDKQSQVTMVFHLYVAEDGAKAREEARLYLDRYLQTFYDSIKFWEGRTSSAYAGYEHLVNAVKAMTYDRILSEGRALIGDPDEVAAQIRALEGRFGHLDELSLQVNYGYMDFEKAQRNVRLFSEKVIPQFR